MELDDILQVISNHTIHEGDAVAYLLVEKAKQGLSVAFIARSKRRAEIVLGWARNFLDNREEWVIGADALRHSGGGIIVGVGEREAECGLRGQRFDLVVRG
jgi:hypothetical protein